MTNEVTKKNKIEKHQLFYCKAGSFGQVQFTGTTKISLATAFIVKHYTYTHHFNYGSNTKHQHY